MQGVRGPNMLVELAFVATWPSPRNWGSSRAGWRGHKGRVGVRGGRRACRAGGGQTCSLVGVHNRLAFPQQLGHVCKRVQMRHSSKDGQAAGATLAARLCQQSLGQTPWVGKQRVQLWLPALARKVWANSAHGTGLRASWTPRRLSASKASASRGVHPQRHGVCRGGVHPQRHGVCRGGVQRHGVCRGGFGAREECAVRQTAVNPAACTLSVRSCSQLEPGKVGSYPPCFHMRKPCWQHSSRDLSTM